MNMKKRYFALALSLAMVLGTIAFAAGDITIPVTTGMKLVVNGAEQAPVNSAGEPIELFAYKGATYAPVRYLAELLGLQVDWDAANPTDAILTGDIPGAVDAFTSASVADYYGDQAITGDELMNTINSFKGSYLVSSVNPDGTPCIGFFIYSCVKDGDTYYLQLGLADNQSKQNILRTGKVMAAYAAAPDAETGYSMAGARMTATVVTDEELIARINTSGYPAIFAEITEVRSLG